MFGVAVASSGGCGSSSGTTQADVAEDGSDDATDSADDPDVGDPDIGGDPDVDDPTELDAEDGGEADADDDADDGSGEVTDAEDTNDADVGDSNTGVCGDGVLDEGEQCDRGELGGATCASLGYTPGVLTCGVDCTWRTGRCASCGDGVCEGAESYGSCPTDCAAVDVAASDRHSCAVLVDGGVRCWGAREGLRAGGLSDVGAPAPVPGLPAAVEVAAGPRHTCVRTLDGEVWCWGRNGFGEAAPGSEPSDVWPPARVDGLPAVTALAAGRNHTCAIAASDGRVWCWGRAVFGQLGAGEPAARRGGPVAVASLAGVSGIAAGADHSCAFVERGAASCWGRNDQHQLGTADAMWRYEPVAASQFTWLVGAGVSHSCATRLNPSEPPIRSGLFCWGSNAYGQLGRAPTDDFIGAQRIAATRPGALDGGLGFTCVLDPLEGAVSCWGANAFGQLGAGAVEASYEPVEVGAGGAVARFDAGRDHVCVLLRDGQVRCWGRNDDGQLGDASGLPLRRGPVAPLGLGGTP